jgi:hypothetical protein
MCCQCNENIQAHLIFKRNKLGRNIWHSGNIFKNIGDEVAEYGLFQQDGALGGTLHIRTLYGTLKDVHGP